MKLEDARLVPLFGAECDGRVVRASGIVALVDHAHDPVATALVIDVCREAAGSVLGPDVVVERLGGLLARSERTIPPFCVVAGARDGIVVTVHGPVDVRVGDGREPVALNGRENETWITRKVVSGTYVSAVLESAALTPLDDLVDLRGGVVRAAGFVLAADVDASGDAPPTPSPPEYYVSSLRPEGDAREHDHAAHDHAAHDHAAPEARAPLPIVGRSLVGNLPPPPPPPVGAAVGAVDAAVAPPVSPSPAAPPPPAPAAPRQPEPSAQTGPGVVEGIHCARGHFNDPRGRFCAVCGVAMHQTSRIVAHDIRPSLGVVVLDDGSSVPLRHDVVVGREPFDHPRVIDGTADPAVLDDAGRSVSRWHAQIRLEGWDVVLVDEGSTNGTFVWDAANSNWQRLTEGRGVALTPGTRVAFGRRSGVFESSHNQRRG